MEDFQLCWLFGLQVNEVREINFSTSGIRIHIVLKIISIVLSGWTFSEATGKHLDLIKPSSNGSVTIYGRICWLW